MKIGAQLYTVSKFCQTVDDFDKSMQKIAKIGYKYVQLSAIGDFGAEKTREITDKHGLSIVLTHTNAQKILEQTDAVIEEHKIMGAGYVGLGMLPGKYMTGAEGIRQFIADYTPAAEKIADAGMKFMYHNHAFEFEKYDGKHIINMMIDGFPKSVGFTIDVYWVQYGGADPCFLISQLKNRVDTIHFKDYRIVDSKPKMAEAMEGNLNWSAIFKVCEESGVKWAFVEQDDCYGKDPFECLETSYRNLHAVGYR